MLSGLDRGELLLDCAPHNILGGVVEGELELVVYVVDESSPVVCSLVMRYSGDT
jgi:hypothetical protein